MTKILTTLFALLACLWLTCSMCYADDPWLSSNDYEHTYTSLPYATDCDSIIVNDMMVCQSFFLSYESKPNEACCSAFQSVAKTKAGCLCKSFAHYHPIGSDHPMGSDDNGMPFTMDLEKAVMIPGVCGITSPFDECDTESSSPAPSPAADHAPEPAPNESPASSSFPSVPNPKPEPNENLVPLFSEASPAPAPVAGKSPPSQITYSISISVVALIISIIFVYLH